MITDSGKFRPGKVDTVLKGCPALLRRERFVEATKCFDWMVFQMKEQVRMDQAAGTVEIWQIQQLMHVDWVR